MEKVKFDYFYGNENENYLFLQLPKALIKETAFKNLSSDSKILYSLFLERTGLSRKNNWKDEKERVYIIYTIAEIMEDLNRCEQKALKCVKELRNTGLIKTIRQGLNKPNLIYVMNFSTELKYTYPPKKKADSGESAGNDESHESKTMKSNVQEPAKEAENAGSVRNDDLQGSGTMNYTVPEPHVSGSIYKNKKNTYNECISIYQKEGKNSQTPDEQPTPAEFDTIDNPPFVETEDETAEAPKSFTPEEVADKIGLDQLKIKYEDNHEDVDLLYSYVCDVLSDSTLPTQPYYRIAGQNIPSATVKTEFLCLEQRHIEYVVDCLNKNGNKYKINKNAKSYIMTSLFHAPRTVNYYSEYSFKKPPEKPSGKGDIDLDEILERKIKKTLNF